MTLAQTLAIKWKEWPNDSIKVVVDGAHTCTRPEWLAAVDALNAPKVVGWDGVGDPPAMSKIEYKSVGGTWKKGVFVGRVYGKIVAGCDETEVVGWLSSGEMRPIRTAEQVAAEEREKEIADMMEVTSDGITCMDRDDALALYKAGYRKQVAK